MNGTVAEEARDLGRSVAEALDAAGGVDLARRFEADPAARAAVAVDLLDPLGLWEIDPREDQVQLEAAAEACRAAGSRLLMYPIAERLARPRGHGAIMLVPTRGRSVASHADLDLDWAGATLSGDCATVVWRGDLLGGKLGAFVADVRTEILHGVPRPNADLLITLQAWWLLGALERVVADTIAYANERVQFGSALIHFQGTQFRLSDAVIASKGLAALAKYTLWSVGRNDPAAGLVDAVALRVAANQAAEAVMRNGHQLYGAMGFADETDISQFSRHTQGVRRLPESSTRSELVLAGLISNGGWASPFPVPAKRGSVAAQA